MQQTWKSNVAPPAVHLLCSVTAHRCCRSLGLPALLCAVAHPACIHALGVVAPAAAGIGLESPLGSVAHRAAAGVSQACQVCGVFPWVRHAGGQDDSRMRVRVEAAGHHLVVASSPSGLSSGAPAAIRRPHRYEFGSLSKGPSAPS